MTAPGNNWAFPGPGINFTANTLTASIAGALPSANTGAITYGGAMSYSDTGVALSLNYVAGYNTYIQAIINNMGSGAVDSADWVASNNNGAANNNYIDTGINSSGFTQINQLSIPSGGYIFTKGGDLSHGTADAHPCHFGANNWTIDAMTISAGNALTFAAGQVSTATLGAFGNIPGGVAVSAAGVSPGATGVDSVLAAFTLPASSFDAAGRELILTAVGQFAATANNKQLKLWAGCTTATVGSAVSGGTVIADSGVLTNSGTGWSISANIVKYGALNSNTQLGCQLGTPTPVSLPKTLTMTENAAIIFAVTGNATTATTDIVYRGLTTKYAN